MNLALIPARAGSKGIKGKNLANLGGHPLIYYTIEAAKNSKFIDEIVVSSDGDEILEFAVKNDVRAIKRPVEISDDVATSDMVVKHTLENIKCENVLLLQPTSPFRNSTHIDEAFGIFINSHNEALISVKECENKILKAFIVENDCLKGICNNTYPFMPRQKLPKTFISNGAIYILKSKLFLTNLSFMQNKTGYYVMDEIPSIDIDCVEDLQNAELILQKIRSHKI